jgi:WD40 repeat protein
MNFHSGAITDMAVSDCVNMAVSCAQDGTIKLWDYARQQPIYERKFNGRAECLDLLRRSDVNKGRVAAVGYESGIVRVVYFAEDTIELGVVFKAADAPIVRIKYAPSQQMLVTASKTGEIFFFECNGHADLSLYSPLCMIQLPDKCSVTDLKWDATSTKILVSGDNGKVYEIQKPVPSQINNRETYLVENYPIKQWRIKMMEF